MEKNHTESIKALRNSIHLAISIADKYNDEKAYQAALVGLYVGLNLYEEKKRTEKLEFYLSWFIKTSTEYTLGYKNDDTDVWGKKFQEEK